MKFFYCIMWLLNIFLGAIFSLYVPTNFLYSYGFAIGTFTFMWVKFAIDK